MHMSKIIKPLSLILALSILSIGGSILINSAIASWSSPTDNPPSGDISTMTLSTMTLSGATLSSTQTANARFYLNSNEGLQMRIDTDANDTNSEFSINNGANQEVFKIDENGNITAKSDYLPTSDKHLATKDYVDAAGGGGDATLANQTSMMGGGFAAGTDSLENIRNAIDSISGGGDASYAKQLEIQSDLQRSIGWVLPNQTYYSVGGNTYFCRSNQVNASGVVAISDINNGSICDTNKQCSDGSCVSVVLLTYSGATHTDLQCDQAGGEVFNSGSGTFCKFTGSSLSCPSGWTQADNWQLYNDGGGWGSYTTGDDCGSWIDVYPTVFSNMMARDSERTGSLLESQGNYWCSDPTRWLEKNPDIIQTFYYAVTSTINPPSSSPTTRQEIGCK